MIAANFRLAPRVRGFVLVSSLLLLLVVTILAVGMFRSFGVEERISGNVRDKLRAVHAAETAQQVAEHFLKQNGLVAAAVDCTAATVPTAPNANAGIIPVCSNGLDDPIALPWQSAGAPAISVPYVPLAPTAMLVTQNIGPETYYQAPQFYITALGAAPSGHGGLIYQIDAVGYGANPNSLAVVESTFLVQPNVTCLGGCQP